MFKYDYIKLKANKREYFFLKEDFRSLTDHDKEYDPVDFGLQALREKDRNYIEKFKFRKKDTHVYATKDEIKELKEFLTSIGLPKIEKEKEQEAKWEEEAKIERAKTHAKALATAEAIAKKYPLPFKLEASDLVTAEDKDDLDYKTREESGLSNISASGSTYSITMYNVINWGWCVPTLHIGNGRHGNTDRAYAVRVSNGECVRVGNGPHVLSTVTVYPKKSNWNRLKPLLELMRVGAVKANTTRDQISTRRMNRRSYW